MALLHLHKRRYHRPSATSGLLPGLLQPLACLRPSRTLSYIPTSATPQKARQVYFRRTRQARAYSTSAPLGLSYSQRSRPTTRCACQAGDTREKNRMPVRSRTLSTGKPSGVVVFVFDGDPPSGITCKPEAGLSLPVLAQRRAYRVSRLTFVCEAALSVSSDQRGTIV